MQGNMVRAMAVPHIELLIYYYYYKKDRQGNDERE